MSVQNEVKIFTKNFIDDNAAIISSHGGTLGNLYNMDNDSPWLNDDQFNFSQWDTVTVTLEFVFKVGAVETQFLADSIILTNNNLREFDVEYWDGSTWVLMVEVTENDDPNLMIKFTQKLTSRMRIIMYTTMLPNERKRIGNLIIARNRINISTNYSLYEISNREKFQSLTLGDGSEHHSYNRFTEMRTSKYGCRVSFDYLTELDYNNLLGLKNEAESFLWYPESDFKSDEIFLVNWVNTFQARYTMKSKLNGWTISMELKEV